MLRDDSAPMAPILPPANAHVTQSAETPDGAAYTRDGVDGWPSPGGAYGGAYGGARGSAEEQAGGRIEGARPESAQEVPGGETGALEGTGERLVDAGSKGRERPWRRHKRESLRVAGAYERLGGMYERRVGRVRACGDVLMFSECADAGHPKRLHAAQFCGDRLCGLCQWRRALKVGHQVRQVVAEVERERPGVAWLLLTLTQRNSGGAALPAAVSELLAGWERLRHARPFMARVVGSFRALEVTCNRERGDYHPHLHALLAVDGEKYFAGRNYLSQKAWRGLWQSALRVDYDPRVDVRRARDLGGASCEVAKYATKPGDFIDLAGGEETADGQEAEAERVGALHAALHGRQLVAYTGALRVAWQALRALGAVDEPDGGDLVHVGEEQGPEGVCATCGRPMLLHRYGWHGRVGATWDDGQYVG